MLQGSKAPKVVVTSVTSPVMWNGDLVSIVDCYG